MMKRARLGRGLAAVVATIAVLHTASALAMPVPERQASLPLILTWFGLLALHAAVYFYGSRIRDRVDLTVYAVAQGAILLAIAVSRPPAPLTIVLFMAGVAELVALAGSAWGSVRITIGAIALLVLASLVTSDVYRATTDGLMLAVTGLIAHAVAGLLERPIADVARTVPSARAEGWAALSGREIEVLRELVNGARNSNIAETLGITERTVKAHLGSIYQKLGVESRSAAVAMAVKRKLG
jgi:DNA-binding CsgD family transcriptional regulator